MESLFNQPRSCAELVKIRHLGVRFHVAALPPAEEPSFCLSAPFIAGFEIRCICNSHHTPVHAIMGAVGDSHLFVIAVLDGVAVASVFDPVVDEQRYHVFVAFAHAEGEVLSDDAGGLAPPVYAHLDFGAVRACVAYDALSTSIRAVILCGQGKTVIPSELRETCLTLECISCLKPSALPLLRDEVRPSKPVHV